MGHYVVMQNNYDTIAPQVNFSHTIPDFKCLRNKSYLNTLKLFVKYRLLICVRTDKRTDGRKFELLCRTLLQAFSTIHFFSR